MHRRHDESDADHSWAAAVGSLADALAATERATLVESEATAVTAASIALSTTAPVAVLAAHGTPAASLAPPAAATVRPSLDPYPPEVTAPFSLRALRRDSTSSTERDADNGGDLNRAAPSYRGDWRLCNVCGDKAVCYNFDVITCESCKAFFRRNAVRTEPLRCNFSSECSITVNTRRFCSACRLRKCFAVGMKKDLILGDVEKRRRMDITLFKRKQQLAGSSSSRRVDAAAADSSSGSSPPRSATPGGDASADCSDTVLDEDRSPAGDGGLPAHHSRHLSSEATVTQHGSLFAQNFSRTASADPSVNLSTPFAIAAETLAANRLSPSGALGPSPVLPLPSAATAASSGQQQQMLQQRASHHQPRRTCSWATAVATDAASPWATASPLRRSDSWTAGYCPSNETSRGLAAQQQEQALQQQQQPLQQQQQELRHSCAFAADEGFASCSSASTTPGLGSSHSRSSPPPAPLSAAAAAAALPRVFGTLPSSATVARRQLSSEDQADIAALVQHYSNTLGSAEAEEEDRSRPPAQPTDLETALNGTGPCVRRLIAFAKGVRGFTDTTVEVQMALLKAAAVPCLLLRTARAYDADDSAASASTTGPPRCPRGRRGSDPVLVLDAAVADRALAGKAAVLVGAAAQLLAAADGRRCDVALLASLSAVALMSPEVVASADWLAVTDAADRSRAAAAAAGHVADAQQRHAGLLGRYVQASLTYGRAAELQPVLLHMLNSCKHYARLVAERLASTRCDVVRVDALLREVYDLRDPAASAGGAASNG